MTLANKTFDPKIIQEYLLSMAALGPNHLYPVNADGFQLIQWDFSSSGHYLSFGKQLGENGWIFCFMVT